MNRACRSALSAMFLALVAIPAHAAGRAECRSVPSKILARAVAYCVLLPPNYDLEKTRRYPVLYFLHGLGQNEQALLDSGGWNLIQDLWDQKQIGEFLIVAPDGGRSFFINSRDGRQRYEDFFVKEFLPFIESHYRLREGRRNRGISGVSMGGYGALHLALSHPDLFGCVSAHSAALIDKLPPGNLDSASAQAISRALGGAFGTPFDRAFWNRSSPFTLVRKGPPPTGLRIYFDCGTEDDFGFNRGAQAFHDLLVSRGIPHEFHLYPGRHDLGYFAEHLPASFEFQSRAFGLTPVGK
ncbi:MAG TPA: alpha/beta hydrolase family protein [Candidatus Acidoferrales bacterium]|jgi:S-formylglutathione hydrolase FrmB|nr:alpha/beta hydrolase family protein [Candidatus Acidoferrales bacterium]